MPQRKASEKTYHIIPVKGVTIPGWSAREHDVTEAEWHAIKAYTPPAFVLALPPVEEEEPPKEGE